MKSIRIRFASWVALPLCWLMGVAALGQHGEAPPQGPVEFAADVAAQIETQRAVTGHLLVKPVINGRPAGWFIFDTGAGICVISTPFAAEFELKPSTVELHASGMGGSAPSTALLASTLQLGPVTLRDVPLMNTDLSFLREHLGVDIAGVIGYGLLAKCIVELDLVTPRIALHEPARYELPAGTWAPLALDDLIPAVTATYEGHQGRFQLDIGSNGGLTINEPTVRRLDLLATREVTDCKLGGVGGYVAAKSGRIATFELGGVSLQDVPAIFAVEAKGIAGQGGRDGSIGTKVLEAFHMTLDYPGQRISLRKRE